MAARKGRLTIRCDYEISDTAEGPRRGLDDTVTAWLMEQATAKLVAPYKLASFTVSVEPDEFAGIARGDVVPNGNPPRRVPDDAYRLVYSYRYWTIVAPADSETWEVGDLLEFADFPDSRYLVLGYRKDAFNDRRLAVLEQCRA